MLPVWCVPQSVIHFLAIRILVERGAEAALMAALRADQPLSAALLLETIERLEPSPLIESEIR